MTPSTPNGTHHIIRVFTAAGTGRHTAVCSCGRNASGDEPSAVISDIISKGCLHGTPVITALGEED